MIYRELPWDSDFFRVSAGALTVEAGDTAEELSAALAEHSAEVCYIFVPQDAGSGLSGWLQTSGAKCYDRKTVFAKPLAGRLPEKLRPEVAEVFSPTGKMVELAVAAGHRSRFRLDGRFRPFQAALYERWLRNCFDSPSGRVWIVRGREGCDAVLCASVKGNSGKIELVAVDEKCRGRGYGKALMNRAEEYFRASGAVSAEVVTQLDNEEACRLYHSCGYGIQGVTEVWHLWRSR